ncbi:NADH-quinone oxidoreductase subunit A [Desulfobulbus oligotrophicus]|uniref:NADH-quinone oxidoreductase subunit A n=1 Tax=Desulfobulbus oligotrophicus TaxID=1909699 RepID=A0A7T6AQT0_9BACT|nr:NADH-quinone oxidoreductase subunit A [Desulfobulbus oligotrophicus]MDY0391660.1 NADH-quinone oxidoreductase subunit A [Desulfobulbus oligotrophicus]QQG66128.1 NADH-quinone oxidoreductase subunit A [Desulfobulbus oligotrophicus]
MNALPAEYLGILLLLIFGALFGVLTLFVGRFFRLSRPYPEKLIAYESGNEPTEAPRMRISVKFYLVAILFVIFDVEAIYLYPWAISYDRLGLFALIEMLLFVVLIFAGYVYAWKKGVLQWEK